MLDELFVEHVDGAKLVVLHLGDGLDAAGDDRVRLAGHDAVGAHGDGLQAGGAEPVDRDARYRRRKASSQQRDPADVVSAGAFRQPTADDHVLDVLVGYLGYVGEGAADGVSCQVVRPGHVERAPVRLGERGPLVGDDDRFWHGYLLVGSK